MKLKTKVFFWVLGLVLAFVLVMVIKAITGRFKSMGKDFQKTAFDIAKVRVDAMVQQREAIKAKVGVNDEKVVAIEVKIKAVGKKRETAKAKMEGKTDAEVTAILDNLGY